MLKDNSPMPISQKHRGKPMDKVPSTFYIWLWNENSLAYKENRINNGATVAVMAYIENNWRAIQARSINLRKRYKRK